MKLGIIIFFLLLLGCASRPIVQGQGIDFSGIVVDTINTPKEKTK
jgi:hypothetical protein